ncbi:MAG: nitroreductase family deazaflavin-dependent oxidoreductase [Nonomuraea sp.]|nr:nitroreductase family deazaflavin-dependent oxidoreductase [Nonomuraea sp.]
MLKPFFQWLAGTDWFMRVGPRIVPRMDRAFGRPVSDLLVPTLVLTTTGARSGLARRTPLACLLEAGGTFLVVGSNFGRPAHPAWSGNLLADPAATVRYRGRDFPVTATLLIGTERAAVWPALLALWPVYALYTEKSGRELRVFRLAR